MDAPTCRLCHKTHWPRERCRYPSTALEVQHVAPTPCAECVKLREEIAALRNQIVTMQRNQSVTSVTSPVTTEGGVTIRVTTAKRDRAEYMRDRRAAAKAA